MPSLPSAKAGPVSHLSFSSGFFEGLLVEDGIKFD